MSEERCETCRFARPNMKADERVVSLYCHARPPVPLPVMPDVQFANGTAWWGFPPVSLDEWCGEWQAKPE